MVLGDGDLLPNDQNRIAAYAHFGLSYPVTDAWSLKGQLDYHSSSSTCRSTSSAARRCRDLRCDVAGDAAFLVGLRDGGGPHGDSTSDVMIQVLIGTTF